MLQENEIFDNTYQIVEEIGHGGSGVIFLAYHLRLRKHVVLKRVAAGISAEAMRTEADLLKNLRHPYLPQVYDFFTFQDQVYTVMDYIPGIDLGKIPRGPENITEQQALKWFRQLAEVLDYLHTRPSPILHSDIKPGNMILTETGDICLIDFGISLGGGAGEKVGGYSRGFAAPEQIWMAQYVSAGQTCDWELDATMDIYSAGATFYYLLTGALPTGGPGDPPLEQYEGLPYSPGLLSVIDKCMAFEREKRFSSARELLAALDSIKKQDRRYKRYVCLQAASILLTAFLTISGVVCVTQGVRRMRTEDFFADYGKFCAAAEAGNDETVEQMGLSILNGSRYRDVLEKNREEKSFLLHAVGRSYDGSGNVEGALHYYQEALSTAESGDGRLGTYYADYALMLLENGRTEEAKVVLEQGISANIEPAALLLIEAELYDREEKSDECVGRVRQLLKLDCPGEYKAKACLIASHAEGVEALESVSFLDQAGTYDSSKWMLRKLGAAYLAAAEVQRDGRVERECSQKALACYEKLCGGMLPTLEDRIGLAVSQFALSQNRDCIETLLDCEKLGERDYRIDLYLAFAFSETGEYAQAEERCESALAQMENAPVAREGLTFEEDRERLIDLQRRLAALVREER